MSRRINHIFVLMLENRSFDHLLGFSGISGMDVDSGEIRAIDGLSGSNFSNEASGVRYEAATGAPYGMAVDPGHSFEDVVEQLGGSGAAYAPGQYPVCAMSGFVSNFTRYAGSADVSTVFKSFGEAQLPAFNALAREFCLCDRWFSSMPGPTMPNRFFVHAASSGGLDDSPDLVTTAGHVLAQGFTFENGTIFDRLSGKGLPWTIWEGDELPTTLLLRGVLPQDFDQPAGRVTSGFRDFAQFTAALQDPAFDTAYNFIEPNYGELYFGQHMKCGTSMHPIDDVTRGDGLIKTAYEAIRNSPHWDDSLLIVTFDEHGGFYDHVPPPQGVAPGDRCQDPSLNKHGFDFRQLGVRVPTIVVSAWTRRNTLDGKNYDHSAVARTLEDLFELEPMTERDASARSLTPQLALSQPRLDALTELPPPSKSNFHGCDGGLLGWLEKVVAELPAAFERDEPPNSVTQTFVHAAVRREVQMSGLEAGAAMATQLEGLKSQHEAATYIHHARLKYRGFTGRPIASSRVEGPQQSVSRQSDARDGHPGVIEH